MRSSTIAVLAALAGVSAWSPLHVHGQCPFEWKPGDVPGLNGAVFATAVYDGALIAGGIFTTAGGISANCIAKWDGSSWSALGGGMNHEVWALTVYNGSLIAGGAFTTAGGNAASYIARWDGNIWSGLGLGMDNGVNALSVYNGALIAGGRFTTAGGASANYIARWNAGTWSPLGSGMGGSDPFVVALAVYNGDLIAGGQFTTADGNSADKIAQWDGNGWSGLGSGISGTYVLSLTVYNGALIAGGDFGLAGGISVSRIAQWNGGTWSALGSGMGEPTDPKVWALTVYDGELVAGGNFTTAGGASANRIARWNGGGWSALGSGVDGSGAPWVYDLVAYNGALIAVGDFTTAGGYVSDNWARWGPPDATTSPLYVDAGASGAHDGTSWADAVSDLPCALNMAAASGGLVEEIWVAAGVYRPATDGDRNASFVLRSGVAVYGGFAGTETTLSERTGLTIVANPSTLSGDLNGDDGPGFTNNGDNSRHVVVASNTDSTAALDGFTIRGGNAELLFPLDDGRGAGLFCDSGQVRITWCNFVENTARRAGSGAFVRSYPTFTAIAPHFESCYFGANDVSSAITRGGALSIETADSSLSSCVFSGNTTPGVGGGLCAFQWNGTVVNSWFYDNASGDHGGGAYLEECQATFVNTLFEANDTGGVGGAIAVFAGATSSTTIVNGTLVNNVASALGGALYLAPGPSGQVTINNTILWGNSDSGAVGGYSQIAPVDGSTVLNRCIIQGGWSGAGSNNLSSNPLFRNPSGDFRLLAGSPAIDAGDNTLVAADTLDIDNDGDTAEPVPYTSWGLGRFSDAITIPDTGVGSPRVVDIGASEHIAPQVLVDSTPTGGWPESGASLQTALYIAENFADEVSEIWVAEGTYTPGVLRTDSFNLVNDVPIYGGFAGTETSRDQRDPAANETILSGDLGSNDVPAQFPDGPSYAENSYHVVTASGVNATAVLDGVTVTRGNANAGDIVNGSGGGMYMSGGSPTVRGCRFTGNYAVPLLPGDYGGGGMAVLDNSSPLAVDCVFDANRSAGHGGGVQVRDTTGAKFINCSFLGNVSEGNNVGGGLHIHVASPELSNCIFSGNTAHQGAGAFFFGSPEVRNCTFSSNRGGLSGGGLTSNSSSPKLRNCVFWGNTTSYSGDTAEEEQVDLYSGGITLSNCLIQGLNAFAGSGNIGADPLFVDADGADNVAGTLDDNVRVFAESPVVDAGDATVLLLDAADLDGDGNTAEVTPLDLAGAPRQADYLCAPNTGVGAPPVDMGAYEYASVPLPNQAVLYVKADATGANDGSSWANAFTNLQDALCAAEAAPIVEEIWVAEGTYRPSQVGDRTRSFALQSGVALYGGFAGDETSREQRDPGAHPAILSGDLKGDDDFDTFPNGSTFGENSFHVVDGSGVSSTAALDGFTIRSGRADGAALIPQAGGLHADGLPGSSPIVSNCRFEYNWASVYGGAVSLTGYGASTFLSCVFERNRAGTSGGAIGCSTNGSLTLADCSFISNVANTGGAMRLERVRAILARCRFERNVAEGLGGAVRVEPHMTGGGTQVDIVGCEFYGNRADATDGGGALNCRSIAVGNTSVTRVSNSVFVGNTAVNGGAVRMDNLSQGIGGLTVTNCTFTGNSAAGSGGGMYNGGTEAPSSPVVNNCVFWNNSDAGGTDESAQIHTDNGAPTVNYSLVQGGWSGAGNIAASPVFVVSPSPGPDGQWDGMNDVYGDLRLSAGSPGIDAGSNALVAPDAADLDCDGNKLEDTPQDANGSPRFVDDDAPDTGVGQGLIVDMGAYETGPLVGSRVFVHAAATDPEPDGSSWERAFPDLNDALEYAAAQGCGALELWVTAGVYTPAPPGGDPDATFQLVDGVVLYGGFTGVEEELGERDYVNNVTTLSGDLNGDDGSGAYGDNVHHVVTGSGTSAVAIVDGFTISGGNAAGSLPGGALLTIAGGPLLRNCTITGNRGDCAGAMAAIGGRFSIDNLTLTANTSDVGASVGLSQSAVDLLGDWIIPDGRLDVYATTIGGAGEVNLGGGSLLRIKATPACGAEVAIRAAGALGATTIFEPDLLTDPPFPARWEVLSGNLTNVSIAGTRTQWVIANTAAGSPPATVQWTGNLRDADLSSAGRADATFRGGGTLTITGRLYDGPGAGAAVIYDCDAACVNAGGEPLLQALVGPFRAREKDLFPDELEFVEKPVLTPTGGFLVSNGMGFIVAGDQYLTINFAPAQQNGGAVTNFPSAPDTMSIATTGLSQLILAPVNPPQAATISSSDIRGTGSLEIETGAKLILAGNATLNLSGQLDSVCGTEQPGILSAGGTASVAGTLLAQDTAQIRNTTIEVSLAHIDGATDVVHNDIRLEQSVEGSATSVGFGGELFVADSATVACNNIFSDGDRYLDLDPDPSDGAQPTIVNNHIFVTIRQGVSGAQGELLELRAQDVDCTAPPCPSGDFLLGASAGGGYDDTWTLQRLEVMDDAKVTLTNRQGFVFQPEGVLTEETLYVKDLVLHDGAVLNTGLQRLYYQTLSMGVGARIVDVPLLGFSLKVIELDDDPEFAVRVRRREAAPGYERPIQPPYAEGSVLRIDQDPEQLVTIPAGAGGAMDLRTRRLPRDGEDAADIQSTTSVGAKGAFARAGDEEILITFDYLFVADPNHDAEIVVYLSDMPDPNPVPDGGDARNVEVARVRQPQSGRAGSIGSGAFARFYGTFPRGDLKNFTRGTYVELELRGQSTRAWIDTWDPQVRCTGTCADLSGDHAVSTADYLYVLGEYGQTLEAAGCTQGAFGCSSKSCLDSRLNGDGYIDFGDLLAWDLYLNNPSALNLCGTGEPEAPLRGGGGPPVSFPDARLVVAGKPTGAGLQEDYLYPLTNAGACDGATQRPASVAGPNGHRGNTRLIADGDGALHQLHTSQGLVRLGDAQVVVAPALIEDFDGNKDVYVGINLTGTGSDFEGVPISDAAFDPNDATIVYIVPVYVDPPGDPYLPDSYAGSPYKAAAKLSLTGDGTFTVLRLYGLDPMDDPCARTTSPPGLNCSAQNVREVEFIPGTGGGANKLLVTAGWAVNDNDWLLIYDEASGAESRMTLNTMGTPLSAPIAMTYVASMDKIYMASSLNLLDATAVQVHRLSVTRDVDGSATGVALEASINVSTMRNVVAMAANPADGGVWILGFTIEVFDANHAFANTDSIASTPTLAIVASSAADGSTVTAAAIECQGLALPVSLAFGSASAVTSGACCIDPPGAGNSTCSDAADAAACDALHFVCDVADHLPGSFLGCYGDADGNGTVNPGDRGFVSANIGLSDPVLVCRFDMDGNGTINAGDRGFISANINLCQPLPDWQNGSGLNHGVADGRFATVTFQGAGTTCATTTCP